MGKTKDMRLDALSADGEYLEAEVIDDGGSDGPKRGRELRFVQSMTAFFAVVFVVSMVGGYVGGGAICMAVEAADSLVAQFAGGSGNGAPLAPAADSVPAGSTAITADGLHVRCPGSFVKPGRGEGGEPTVVVALELQNVGDDKVVLRKSQFAAIGADGKAVEPLDQTLSRGDGGAFCQFTSVAVEPGERLVVCSAFRMAAGPTQVTYRPGKRSRGYGADCTALEIGGAQETMLA